MMIFKFFIGPHIYYGMKVDTKGVKYFLCSTLRDMDRYDMPVTKDHFLKALAYAINTHDGYIMTVEEG